jgi:oligopeptide transport system ATP-binding protein
MGCGTSSGWKLSNPGEKIVEIRDLSVNFETIDGTSRVVQGVSIDINEGEVVGVVGETGCGKTLVAKTLLGILPIPPGSIEKGEVYFLGIDLLKAKRAVRERCKQKVAYVPQDPMASLNPVFLIGSLMVDMIIWNMSNYNLLTYLRKRRDRHLKKVAENYAAELLDRVHIADPNSIMNKYPIELSGGMRQRVLLAMALRGNPKLLVADEPTTALDATIQKRIINLIQEKINEEKMSGFYVTHNLGVARIIANRTYVMYAGAVVESGHTPELLDHPLHPYTKGLVSAIPRLTKEAFRGIEGQIPDYLEPPSGCRFHPRCNQRLNICSREVPKRFATEKDRWVACWLYP